MEIVESGITNELAIIEDDAGDDELYEGIQAPKFVDFTVPDRSRPDDRSWFCARVGCDQQHEEIDHDALHKSFMLRVMAARSPNVKLQKALNRQNPRLTRNCPRSAPAKSAKDRVSRLSTLASGPDKFAKSRPMKDHPVSILRSTPKKTKATLQPTTSSSKKALTTPRTRRTVDDHEPFRSVKCQKKAPADGGPKSKSVAKALFLKTPNRTASEVLKEQIPTSGNKKAVTTPRTRKCPDDHEPFRSVKHQKAPPVKGLKKTVAKALFLQTPMETYRGASPTISEVCDGVKKLNIDSLKKKKKHTIRDPETYLKKTEEPSAWEKKIKLIVDEPSANVEENLEVITEEVRGLIDPETYLKRTEEPSASEKKIKLIVDEPSANVEENLKVIMEEVRDLIDPETYLKRTEGYSASEKKVKLVDEPSANVEENLKVIMEEVRDLIDPEINLKRTEESSASEKNIKLVLLQGVRDEPSANVEESSATSPESTTKEPLKAIMEAPPICKGSNTQCSPKEASERSSLVDQASRGEATGTGIVDDFHVPDENKENASGTSNMNSSSTKSDTQILQIETCDKIPQKDIQAPSKIIQRQCARGGKPKRATTTNPKPFRLRTDERGILKEANLERRLKLEAQKETLSEQQNGQAAPADLQTGASKEEPSRARATCFKRVRFVESRYANIKPKFQKPENKSGALESENNSVKLASSRPIKTKSSEAARTMQDSQLRKRGVLTKDDKPTAANPAVCCSKGRRPAAAVTKVSTSSRRLHLPKSCAMTVS